MTDETMIKVPRSEWLAVYLETRSLPHEAEEFWIIARPADIDAAHDLLREIEREEKESYELAAWFDAHPHAGI